MGVFTIQDVYREICSLRRKCDRRRNEYRESLENRFGDLVNMMGDVYCTLDCHDLEFLQTKSVVWRLNGLSAEHAAIFVADLMFYLSESRS